MEKATGLSAAGFCVKTDVKTLPEFNAIDNANGRLLAEDSSGLVVIRMRPDDEGRFGFNVKARTEID